MKKLTQTIMLVACLAFGMSARATPFLFTYEGEINSITSPSLGGLMSIGDMLSINVYMDNGGTTAINQNWLYGDTVSADLTVGSYSASYMADWAPQLGYAFVTDANSHLTYVNWQGTLNSLINTDSLGTGGGVRLFDNAIQAYPSDGYAFYTPQLHLSDTWTDPVDASVPEPATLALFGIGLAGLGFARKKRQSV